jgi:tetratricopeptide (TPR) repeat protein
LASPNSSESLYNEAHRLFREEKLSEAIQKLEILIQADPSFEDAYEALAILYSRVGRLDDAIETAKAWIRLNPHTIMAHTNLSRFFMEKGMIAEAEQEQGEARRLTWAEELKRKKMEMPKVDPRAKIERYQKVIELDPNDVLGYYTLGDAYLENKMYREAAETFAKGLKVDPKHSSSYYGLGQAYQALGEIEKAKDVFKQGVEVAGAQGDVMPQRKMEARLRQLS